MSWSPPLRMLCLFARPFRTFPYILPKLPSTRVVLRMIVFGSESVLISSSALPFRLPNPGPFFFPLMVPQTFGFHFSLSVPQLRGSLPGKTFLPANPGSYHATSSSYPQAPVPPHPPVNGVWIIPPPPVTPFELVYFSNLVPCGTA